MPIYLNDLSITDPADTEVVSQGASRIRTLTEAAKTTMDVEHTQTGEHQFQTTQPGSPINGQIWFDLVNKILRRYDGTDHAQLNAVAFGFNSAVSTVVLTGSYVTQITVSVTTFVNSRVLLIGQFIGATSSTLEAKFVRGVTDVSVRTSAYSFSGLTLAVPICYIDIDEPTAGMYTYGLQARGSGSFFINPFIAAVIF